ncbi:unnamed protein product [Amaranthus hypochondriacus]
MEKWEEVPLKQSQNAEVTSLMQNRLAPLGSSSCAGPGRWNPYILTIPEYYRKDNKDNYRPFTTSIGPVYFKDPTLETMQEIKWTFLNLFLQHPKNAYRNKLEHYVQFVTQREVNIRMCYEEILLRRNPISIEDFIQMIILDATFIISLFLLYIGELENPNLPDNVRPLLNYYLRRDMYLMENQLPFFILYELFDTSFGSAFHKSFTEIACGFMYGNFFLRTKDSIIYPTRNDDPTSIKHLIDLFRILCLHELNFNRQKIEDTALDVSNMSDFSLKELEAAGVKIDPSEKRQVVHIEYENGVLKIPKIVIYDSTESQLRNMLYFEQSHSAGTYNYFIAAYVCFMDKLINTAEDVEILIQNKILIYNGLGSNEAVAKLFNNLTKYILISNRNYYYWDISTELNAYASKRWHRWKAVLKMQYFNYPWSIISVVAAEILFILTLLQTIAAFK